MGGGVLVKSEHFEQQATKERRREITLRLDDGTSKYAIERLSPFLNFMSWLLEANVCFHVLSV